MPGTEPPAPEEPSSGMSITALVLGIVSIPLLCVWPLALFCGIAAIVLGIVAHRHIRAGRGSGSGMATGGIACGAFSTILSIVAIVILAVFVAREGWEGLMEQYKQLLEQQQQEQVEQAPAPSGRPDQPEDEPIRQPTGSEQQP